MAVLSFIAIPLFGDFLPFGPIPQVGAGIVLILLAGLTHAKSTFVLIADATFSGVSVLLLETVAIMTRATQSMPLFAARELGVVIMLVAFYLSVKTARNILTGKIGRPDSPLEFEEPIQE